MRIATCFELNESSSGYSLDHIPDTSSTVHILGSQKAMVSNTSSASHITAKKVEAICEKDEMMFLYNKNKIFGGIPKYALYLMYLQYGSTNNLMTP